MGILFVLTTETAKDKDGQVKLSKQLLFFRWVMRCCNERSGQRDPVKFENTYLRYQSKTETTTAPILFFFTAVRMPMVPTKQTVGR